MVQDLYSVRDDGVLILAVQASPGAGRSAAVGRHGNALKVRVAAPPEGGRANEALVKLLAAEFGVAQSAITLVSGERSRAKRFAVAGVEEEDAVRGIERLVEGHEAPGRAARDRPHP